MPELDGRGPCTVNSCQCAGFLTSSRYLTTPTSPAEQCVCIHPWWQHAMLAPNKFSNNRGGNSQLSCGGFYPQDDGEPWNAQSLCMCNRTWLSHGIWAIDIRTGSGHVNALSSGRTPAAVPPFATRPAGGSPVSAFIPHSNSFAGDAVARRNISIQRMNRNHGGVVHRGHARGGSRAIDARTNRRFPTVPLSLATDFLAVILPFKPSVGSSSVPDYRFTLEQVSVLLTVLESHYLTFSISLHEQDEVWKDVNEQISRGLNRSGIMMTHSTSSSTSDMGYFDSPMTLITARTTQQEDRRLFKSTGLVAATFTISALLRISNKVTNPRDSDRRPLLFFAPRFTHLSGPVQSGGPPHPCFPWHVWKGLQEISTTSTNVEGDHVAGCPTDMQVEQMASPALCRDSGNPSTVTLADERLLSGSAGHMPASQSSDAASSRGPSSLVNSLRSPISSLPSSATLGRQQPNLGTGVDLAAPSHPALCSSNSVRVPPATGCSFHAVPNPLPTNRTSSSESSRISTTSPHAQNLTIEATTLPRASYTAVSLWRHDVFQTNCQPVFSEGLKITGPTPDAIARTLIKLLKFHHSSHMPSQRVFEAPPGVSCRLQPLRSFIRPFHRIRLLSRPQSRLAAVGDGPVRAVLRAGVHALVQNSPLFGFHGDFYHPILLSIESSPRVEPFWAAGFWCALHMLILGITPDPITPWLFYAFAYGKEGLPRDLGYIRVLDPTSANDLQPWFNFLATDVIQPDDYTHPVRQLLVSHLEIHDLSLFASPRTPEFHDATGRALIASVLLGHSDPWEFAEFKAFQDGFNLDLGSKRLLETLQLTDEPDFCRKLLAAMSNRRIARVQDVVDMLEFNTADDTHSEVHHLLRCIFQYRVVRWLRGKGHPAPLRGTHIPESVHDSERDDPLVRARLLVRAISDSDLLPHDPSSRFTFTLNVGESSGLSDERLVPCAVDIHTCDTRVVVTIDEWLRTALREECHFDDESPTVFDLWFHTQMMPTDYNRI